MSCSTAAALDAPVKAATRLAAIASAAALAYDPRAEAAQSKRVAVLVGAAALLAGALARPDRARRIELSRAAIALGAFVLLSAVSLAWGAPAGAGKLATWVGATAIGLAAARLPEAEARAAARLAGLVTGGGSAAIALVQGAAGARGLAIHGGAGNPNWLGLVVAASLPLAIDAARAWSPTRGLATPRVALAWGVVVAELAALAACEGRTAWVATAVGLAVWSGGAAARAPRPRAPAIAGLAVVALGAALLVAPRVAIPLREAPGGESTQTDNTGQSARGEASVARAWEGRVWIWRVSAAAAREALPLGVGLGGFARAFLEAQGERLAPLPLGEASRRFVNATSAHDDWLEAAVESGPLAPLALAAALALGAAAALGARWGAGAASLVAVAVSAIGDSPLLLPGVAVVLALVLAALPRRASAPPALLGAALAASAALLAPSTSAWLAARSLTAASVAEPRERLARLEAAARVDPTSGEAALALGLARLDAGDARGALVDLERSRARLANVGTDVAIGNARLQLGDAEGADAAYTRALALHPASFRAHANRAVALTSLARLEEADAHLAAARALWPGHPKLASIAAAVERARLDRETGAAACGTNCPQVTVP